MQTAGDYVGLGVILLALLAFVRFFLAKQISDLRSDVDRLEAKVDRLEAENSTQRSLKHAARTELTRLYLLMKIIRVHAEQCTCGALDAVRNILDSVADDEDRALAVVDPPGHRRHDDPIEGASA